VDSQWQGTSFYAAYDNRIGIICQGILNMRLKRGLMADVRGVWLPKSQKADISFLSSCGINRRIHHPTANSRLDDPESPVNTSRLPITNRGKRASDHFRVANNLSGTLVIISQNPVRDSFLAVDHSSRIVGTAMCRLRRAWFSRHLVRASAIGG